MSIIFWSLCSYEKEIHCFFLGQNGKKLLVFLKEKETMISVNSFDGQLRVRTPMFRKEHVVEEVTAVIRLVSGITSVESNLKTGSILVKYNSDELPKHLQSSLEGMLAEVKAVYKKHWDRDYEVYRPYVQKAKQIIEGLSST